MGTKKGGWPTHFAEASQTSCGGGSLAALPTASSGRFLCLGRVVPYSAGVWPSSGRGTPWALLLSPLAAAAPPPTRSMVVPRELAFLSFFINSFLPPREEQHGVQRHTCNRSLKAVPDNSA